MANISEWFGLYSSLRDKVGETAAATQAVRAQLEAWNTAITGGSQPYTQQILVALNAIAGAHGTDPTTAIQNIAEELKVLYVHLENTYKNEIRPDVAVIGSTLLNFETTFEIFIRGIYNLLDNMTKGVKDSAEAQQEIAERITKLIDELFAEHSPSLIDTIKSLMSNLLAWAPGLGAALPQGLELIGRLLPEGQIKNTITDVNNLGSDAIGTGKAILALLETPLREALKLANKGLIDNFTQSAPAKIEAPTEPAINAIVLGTEFGMLAHGLAVAGEMFHPLKNLGIGQLAAYFSDLAGFKPVAGALTSALTDGAVKRPMHWWGNAVFQPEIPSIGDLETLVQKRVIDEQTYIGYLAYHGFPREVADYFAQTVWRDFSIRDVALAMEDTTIDPSWLEPRIMRIGYDDTDAQQITKSLVQRGAKTARFRVMTAAYSAVSSGSISIEDYRTILQGLDLRQTTIDYEVQAATIASHNDYVKDSIAVYRKQYVNGVIDEGSFRVALSALGLPSERIELVAADAWAQIAPRIAREERAQIEDVMREVQRYLVPAYRELMELGLINDDQYVQALIDAGVSMQIAQQSAILARMRINAVATRTKNKAAERELAQLYSEREELYVEMYRREQITEGGLASSLASLGIDPQRVAAIVDTERTRKIPPISRPPKPPADAKERYIRDLAIQAAVAAFRTGKITEGALKQALINNQMSAEEADALVQLEVARKR